ncbi:hypothetical protein ABIF38_008630 [Bradyrhizobium japonicum]|jgi:hypothetical protein|uniref:Uncharacterized protein n=1 Tax=Bradyrhizobium elkanii TaxID=29448 RepID=A0A8I2C900_BRAEL|nr:hypothetical protein [Bradyrhizobium elkanii]MCS4007198.1 hypothetical protein [Bradyrhizobium elkanii USDA 61]MBP2428726.1 hypothetical protein [Bradyrhizobium elkanii]MCP1729054.1 hypothetical protein [Bradyrhizobium elkanii]MCP1755792.1 hypothetical protein [Bradyrhizobium elkanii]
MDVSAAILPAASIATGNSPAGVFFACSSIGTLIYSQQSTLFRIEKMPIERRVQRTS